MKNLNKLTINSERLIRDKELVELKGGYGGCGYFLCSCYGIPDAWWKCYCSIASMESELQRRCGALGGYCGNAGSC